jgi:hypothetical protein
LRVTVGAASVVAAGVGAGAGATWATVALGCADWAFVAVAKPMSTHGTKKSSLAGAFMFPPRRCGEAVLSLRR